MRATRPVELPDALWQALQRGMAWRRPDRPGEISALLTPERMAGSAAAPLHEPQRDSNRSRLAYRAVVATGVVAIGTLLVWIGLRLIAEPSARPRLAPPSSAATAPQAPAPAATVESAANTAPPVTSADAAGTSAVVVDPPSQDPGSSASAARSLVGFDAPSVIVGEGTRAAALTIRRQDRSSTRAQVNWQIRPDTATAGDDFTTPLTGIAVLASGQKLRVLYIPILDDSDSEQTERFVVVLKPTRSTTTTAQSDRLEVSILDND